MLDVLGFTEHSYAHVGKVAADAAYLLTELGYDAHTIELARIAAWMHDIGNVVNRHGHAETGAVMAFRILDRLGIAPQDLAIVVGAIGNHDEGTGTAVSPVSAALIIADKCDVRRSRVRNSDMSKFDIHDRVNYAVIHTALRLDREAGEVGLTLRIDTQICPVMDYFEIFLSRMLMCRRAAEFLGLKFTLTINDTRLL